MHKTTYRLHCRVRKFHKIVASLLACMMLSSVTSCTQWAPDGVEPVVQATGDEVTAGLALKYDMEKKCYTDGTGTDYILQKKGTWWGRNWKWVVSGIAGIALGAMIANGGGGGSSDNPSGDGSVGETAGGSSGGSGGGGGGGGSSGGSSSSSSSSSSGGSSSSSSSSSSGGSSSGETW